MARDYQLNPPEGREQTSTPENDEMTWNLAIVEALAEGVHPLTGEELDKGSVFTDERVQRALTAAKEALEKQREREARRATLPGKAGNPWSDEEDQVLVERFEGGMTFAELSKEHGRTAGAIKSRLTKLGKLMP